MLDGTQMTDATKRAPESAQRVSCPSCGHLLFMVKTPVGEQTSIGVEIKCKASRCGRFVNVTFAAGKMSLSLQ